MHYERVIPAVRYMADLLSGLVWDLFGPGEQSRRRLGAHPEAREEVDGES